MKLLSSPTSPYARKVRITLIEKGLADVVEILAANALASGEEAGPLRAVNPLGKLPALILDSGTALYDSPVICEYLDLVGSGPRLLAEAGDARWTALRRQALGDGVSDAAFATVMELRRPEPERSAWWIDRWQSAILRAADAVEMELAAGEIAFDQGAVSLIAAFSYVTFRLPAIDWRGGRPRLTAWMAAAEARPSVAATAPPLG